MKVLVADVSKPEAFLQAIRQHATWETLAVLPKPPEKLVPPPKNRLRPGLFKTLYALAGGEAKSDRALVSLIVTYNFVYWHRPSSIGRIRKLAGFVNRVLTNASVSTLQAERRGDISRVPETKPIKYQPTEASAEFWSPFIAEAQRLHKKKPATPK